MAIAAAESCADCTHPRAYHGGGKDCRSSGCLCERWQGPRPAPMEFPELVVERSVQGIHIGTPRLRYRGEWLDFPTIGAFCVEMADDSVTTLTVAIPVSIVIGEPEPDE